MYIYICMYVCKYIYICIDVFKFTVGSFVCFYFCMHACMHIRYMQILYVTMSVCTYVHM